MLAVFRRDRKRPAIFDTKVTGKKCNAALALLSRTSDVRISAKRTPYSGIRAKRGVSEKEPETSDSREFCRIPADVPDSAVEKEESQGTYRRTITRISLARSRRPLALFGSGSRILPV